MPVARYRKGRWIAFAMVLMMAVPTIALIPAPAGAEDRQVALVNLSAGTTYQTITGWEATAWMGQDGDHHLANYSAEVIDMAVNELGLNRLRLEVRAGVENPVDYWTQYQEGVVDYTFWRSRRYTTVNDDADPDNINWSGYQFSELDNTVETVVQPFMQAVQANGETPLINLNYVAFTGQNGAGTQYIHDDPDEYAEMMLATFIHLDTNYSLVPDYIEPILEPDNVAQWNGYTIGNAIVATKAKLAANGYNPRFIAPSNTNMGNAITYFDQMATVYGAVSALDELSYHRYGGVSDANLRTIDQRRRSYNVDTAMLEHIGSGHEDLHKDLTWANCSSWQQFGLAGFGPGDSGASYLLIDETDPADPDVTMGWRSKFLRQYFAYIRPGATRIGATTSEPAVQPIGFINADGGYVVVAKASQAESITVSGLPAGTYGVTYTTSSVYDVRLTDVTVSLGGTLSTSIPAAGVLTVFELGRAPVIDVYPTDPEMTIHEDSSVNFTATPREVDPWELEFSWALDGVQVSTSTYFDYHAGFDAAGEHQLVVTVRDAQAPESYTTFTWVITVLDVNRPPVIASYDPDSVWSVDEEADGHVTFSVMVNDPDDDVLTYTWLRNSVEVHSGPEASYVFDYDFNSQGYHYVTVQVTDGKDTDAFAWTLNILNSNRPPTLVSRDPGETVEADEEEHGSLSLSVNVWDPDGDRITYEWTLDGVVQYGQRYTSYTFHYDHQSAGQHVVAVAASDGMGELGVSWLITINDINVPPRIDYTYPYYRQYVSETEDGILELEATATDPEGADLTYMWDINGTPVPGEAEAKFVFRYDHNSSGEHLVNVTVSDGEAIATYGWTIWIYDVNREPYINSTEPEGNRVIHDRDVLDITVDAVDPDGDDLSYQWYLNGTVIEGITGPICKFDPEQPGDFVFSMVVYDNRGGFDSHEWTVTVTAYVEEEFEMPWWGYVLILLLFFGGLIWFLWWGLERRARMMQYYR